MPQHVPVPFLVSSVFHPLKFFEQIRIEHFDVRSLHAERLRLNEPRRLEFSQRIDDDGARDLRAIRDLSLIHI